MCAVCGCGGPEVSSEQAEARPRYRALPKRGAERAIQLEARVLGENDRIAAHNRAHFRAHGVLALNVLSSPGSGKTTLLCTLIERLQRGSPSLELAVIEGDQQTSRDADRIRALGVAALQINTGKGCHLDAGMVGAAFERLALHAQRPGGVLFIENVGNLVCPALWDLGEHAKVVVISVTEGDDKPLKYPDMFAAAGLLVVSKIDLLPHVSFDVGACVSYARRLNPALEVIELSATRGDGIEALIAWLHRERERVECAP